jgi:hypothetical protein
MIKMVKKIFASLKNKTQVLIFDEKSGYFDKISKSFSLDLKNHKKVNFKENLNSNLDDNEIYFIGLSDNEEKQFFEDIKLNINSLDNNLIKKEEYKNVKTIYLVDSDSNCIYLKKIFPTEHLESKSFLGFNDKPNFSKESNKIAISSRIDIFYDINKKELYFHNFNTLKSIFLEAITFYREASKEESKTFFSEENFELKDTIFDNTTTKFKRRLGVLIDGGIDFKNKKLMKKYESYGKKWSIKFQKEGNKYVLKTKSQLENFVKVFEEVFYETSITKEARETDNFRTIRKNKNGSK